MRPKIEMLKEKKLIGQKLMMSLSNNRTAELWRKFAPRIKEIENRPSTEKISMQIYHSTYFLDFSMDDEFEKWAVVEVDNLDAIPNEIESFILEGGLYAVFDYKGSSSDSSIFQYIFTKWLPNSGYQLDNRPHFEVLGDKYKNNDPSSEEEIWIPIKIKSYDTTDH